MTAQDMGVRQQPFHFQFVSLGAHYKMLKRKMPVLRKKMLRNFLERTLKENANPVARIVL